MNRHVYFRQQEENYLAHHGILGQKWGIRRYQNKDGTLTEEGKQRYKRSAERYIKRCYNSSVMQAGPYKGLVRYINAKEGGAEGTVVFFSKPGVTDVDQINMAKEFGDSFRNSKKFKELNNDIMKYAEEYTQKPKYVKPLVVSDVDKKGGLVSYIDSNDNWYEVDYNPFTKTHGEIKYKGNH